MLSKKLFLFLLSCTIVHFTGYTQQPNPHYQLKGNNYVSAKNYYLLTLMQNTPAVKHLLESDADLTKLATTKLNALKTSLSCKDAACYTAQLKFSPDEIRQTGDKLAALYQPDNALGLLVKTDLIPSGAYILNKNLTPQQQLVKAWEQDAAGVNYAISIYADGKKPPYAAIDSISFNVRSKTYPDVLLDEASVVLNACKDSKLFFEPVLNYALQALEINGRNDAANFEPLAAGLNKNALVKIKQTVWDKYKYSSILILGAGPGDLNTAISPIGMLRCRMGASRYFSGLAPFIIVSGGMAHPYKTKYCEALEMKKYLVNNLHVPANAIIVETQARHTTTNVRNGVRLIYRYGIPFNKPFLTVSSRSHIESVGVAMAARCLRELKYVPYKVGNRYDDNAWELYPAIEALQINPMEPLDPR
ncbi:YdcF family protein [Mucilaginibacter boryungensis]|uniref:YdcF family protein n=1 Tax=Mucilaginibacter boryungensis TaxID=768480 RepID=A0ABR9XD29_9SPHI|nr:YdcF family protein [Mucilaginibacter boryungensis]MBE9664879.1 YdcF family protein [Mucilaginibacter boryungensis]